MRQAVVATGGTRRISIHAGSAAVDVVLSASVAVELLIPAIVDALAGWSDVNPGLIPVRYQLSTLGGTVLEASKTLKDNGIRDGTTLVLTQSSMSFVAPASDDAAEAVSAAVASVERRWSRRAAQLAGALGAGCGAGVSAAVLLRTASRRRRGTPRGLCRPSRDDQCARPAGSGSRTPRARRTQRRLDAGLDRHRVRGTCRTACRSRWPRRPECALRDGSGGHCCGDSSRDRLSRSPVRSPGTLCVDVLGGRRRMRGGGKAALSHRCGARGNIVGDDRSIAPDVGHAGAVAT